MSFDTESQMVSLQTKFACQDSLRQRRGRAGRVQKGRCFRIISTNFFTKLPEHSVPEVTYSYSPFNFVPAVINFCNISFSYYRCYEYPWTI